MADNTLSDFSPRYKGSSFEHMVETFTGNFGPFDASPVGSAQDFHWTNDFWSDGTITLMTSQFSSEWSATASPDMQQWLSAIIPRTGAVDVALGGDVIEGTSGGLLLVNNHQAERFFVTTRSSQVSHRTEQMAAIYRTPKAQR